MNNFYDIRVFKPNIQELIDFNARQSSNYVQIKKFIETSLFLETINYRNCHHSWKKRKLGNIFIKNSEKNNGKFNEDKTISIAKMKYKTGGNGASKESLANYKVIRKGYLGFEGHTSNDFMFGRFVLDDIGDGIMSPRFASLKPIENYDMNFMKYYINFEPIMRRILVLSTNQGIMMNEFVYNDFYNQNIKLPDINEQKHIGNLIKSIDEKIYLNNKNVQNLMSLKQFLKIRFKGFTDAWEDQKL